MFGERESTIGNPVHNDMIWKDHIRAEYRVSKKWREADQLAQAAAGPSSSYKQSQVAQGDVERIKYPLTTSGVIGWHIEESKQEIEKFESERQGTVDFLKALKWPVEAI